MIDYDAGTLFTSRIWVYVLETSPKVPGEDHKNNSHEGRGKNSSRMSGAVLFLRWINSS